MPSSDRHSYQARRRAERMLLTLGAELRDARLTAGLSQRTVAAVAATSDSKLSRIEAGRSKSLSLVDAVVLADAVGLDLSVKAYPGRRPTRDAPQARRLKAFLAHVGSPLLYKTEAGLPPRLDGIPEQRAWDALISDQEGDTGVELEQRLYDIQAQTRRILRKWRDSGVDRLLLVVADTRGNRRVLNEFADLFPELPRLKTAAVLAQLDAGKRPPTGLILF